MLQDELRQITRTLGQAGSTDIVNLVATRAEDGGLLPPDARATISLPRLTLQNPDGVSPAAQAAAAPAADGLPISGETAADDAPRTAAGALSTLPASTAPATAGASAASHAAPTGDPAANQGAQDTAMPDATGPEDASALDQQGSDPPQQPSCAASGYIPTAAAHPDANGSAAGLPKPTANGGLAHALPPAHVEQSSEQPSGRPADLLPGSASGSKSTTAVGQKRKVQFDDRPAKAVRTMSDASPGPVVQSCSEEQRSSSPEPDGVLDVPSAVPSGADAAAEEPVGSTQTNGAAAEGAPSDAAGVAAGSGGAPPNQVANPFFLSAPSFIQEPG